MLSQRNRLARRSDVVTVLRRGSCVRSPGLSVRFWRTGRSNSRFAFVVSNQVSKRSTERNRLRRQLREITRRWLPAIRPGYDIVVSLYPGRPVQATEMVAANLRRGLERSRLLNL